MSTSEWSVCESDEEWNQYNPPKGYAGKEDIFVPQRLAMMFEDIKQKKILPLTCTCPRIGTNTEIARDPSSDKELQLASSTTGTGGVQSTTKEDTRDSETKDVVDTSKTYEAFDFDDDGIDKGPTSAKRKTPGGSNAKRPKKDKVGSLSNVVNDIRRQQRLDEMEVEATAKDSEGIVAEKK